MTITAAPNGRKDRSHRKGLCVYIGDVLAFWPMSYLYFVQAGNWVLSSFPAEAELSQEYEWRMTDSRRLRPGELKWKQEKDMLGQLTSELTNHSEICRDDIPELANKRVCDTPIFHRRSFVRDGIPQQIKWIVRGNIPQWTTRDDQPHRRYSWQHFQSWSRNLFVATFHSRLQRALFRGYIQQHVNKSVHGNLTQQVSKRPRENIP